MLVLFFGWQAKSRWRGKRENKKNKKAHKQSCRSKLRLEGEKKHTRFALVLRRQWVGSRFPLSEGLALLTEQKILSCFGLAVQAQPGLTI